VIACFVDIGDQLSFHNSLISAENNIAYFSLMKLKARFDSLDN
jgi:hypothetical protein